MCLYLSWLLHLISSFVSISSSSTMISSSNSTQIFSLYALAPALFSCALKALSGISLRFLASVCHQTNTPFQLHFMHAWNAYRRDLPDFVLAMIRESFGTGAHPGLLLIRSVLELFLLVSAENASRSLIVPSVSMHLSTSKTL